jgi:hypothetical protein
MQTTRKAPSTKAKARTPNHNLPPLVKTACVKIEFSFLNRNLMVRAGHPSIFNPRATIERAELDGQISTAALAAQRQKSYLRQDRHVSSDLAIDILPPTAKWFRLSLRFRQHVSAGAAWLADGEQI